MTEFLTLDHFHLKDKTVLLREDYNVPMQGGRVTDTTRLERSLPTLRDLAKAGARIVILAHLGRPKGKPDPEFSLRPVAAALSEIWGQPVAFAADCKGTLARAALDHLKPGEILLLENTRFYEGEEKNDPELVREMALLGDIFINDAFSAAHRAHASTTGLAQVLPAAAGRLMQEELEALSKALEKPQRPVAAIVGGAKISTKLDLLNNLVAKVDMLILGGGMANTFLAAKGVKVGKSLYEAEMLDTARAIMKEADRRKCKIVLPTDAVVAGELKAGVPVETVDIEDVPEDKMILDLGPQSSSDILKSFATCCTVVWNGPLGVFEIPPFDRATNEIAKGVAELTRLGHLLSVGGGGDTVAALAHAGVSKDISYISTAGGAFLEWLEGKELPGVAALRRQATKWKKPAEEKK